LARRVLPAGGFGNMAQEVIIASGRGGRVWDMSGKRICRLSARFRPHAGRPRASGVVAVVEEQVRKGTTFFHQQ